MDRKLSTMMMLGAGMIENFNPDTYLRNDAGKWCGCAIGMACLAAGEESASHRHNIFPWLNTNPEGSSVNYDTVISQKFRDVCYQAQNESRAPSLDGLADWIRSVEPECGECNMHNCICAEMKVMEEMGVAEETEPAFA
jgi:hypothetical protein